VKTFKLSLFPKTETEYRLRLSDETGELLEDSVVNDQEIRAHLGETESRYRASAAHLQQLGRFLFEWLDGNNARLRGLLQPMQPLALHISVDAGLRHLPWELLYDGNDYLCAHATRLFTPLRAVLDRQIDVSTANRPLRILFMAASPEQVKPVLEFEQEEARILDATRRQAIELQVEESGSLEGLREQVESFPQGHFDVFHLTGHADLDDDGIPVFVTEDPVGNQRFSKVEDLARVFSDSGRFPRLVFLSGCRTGQSPDQGGLPSFSESLVNAGAPAVLGWALPVGDQAATVAAGFLYDKLAAGVAVDQAVAFARQQLCEQRSRYWHLLRLYCDTSELKPLVTPLRTPGRERFQVREARSEILDAGGKVEVCNRTQFVGRRRLLQRCLRALRSFPDDPHYAEGVLLHGMGGLGKSSAAARLLERLRATHKAVVWHGGLDEIELIRVLSDKVESAGEILNQPGKLTLKQRLIALLGQTGPMLLLFDDFEQNTEEKAAETPRFKPKALKVLNDVMLAIHESGTETRVIVTSRLQVQVTEPARWHAETPETLRGADLNKKLRQLEALHESAATDQALREKALDLSAGNPRLLEWLNKVLADTGTDHATILARLERKRAEFREDVLAEALLEQQPSQVRRVLACAALYRLPVTADAVGALTDVEHSEEKLRRAALVGLVEIGFSGEQDHYFVSSLLHEYLQEELSETERQEALGKAARHLYEKEWKPGTAISEERSLEILRLACAAGEKEIGVEVADGLARFAIGQHRYREAERWCRDALALGEDYRLLHTLAIAEVVLGREAAKENFEKALAFAPPIDDKTPDEVRKEIAQTKSNFCNLLIRKGSVEKALEILHNEVLPVFEKLGDVRSRAVTMGKIADILQARGQLDEALRIREEEQLPVYEKLGDVRSRAVTMGQIADILQARGQLDEALRIREEEEIPVYEKLGDVRELLIGRAKLAVLLWQRDGADAADEVNRLLCLALEDAHRLRIPEAGVIEGFLQRLEMGCGD
jgi:tetratricopeptide (TPR) repeat protein